ncbi:TPA: LysR family transcriptional regulator [Serratia marcescens]|nr:LysR family transcriptional regulator [Serratia marcescens]
MDRLDELAIFVAVVQQGSLAAAGRKLRRSAPAITRAIAALEQRFGTRLVERTTRRLAPTEAGMRLLERAQQLLQDYQAVVQDTAEAQLSGLLRVTSPVQFGRRYVAPVVMAFLDDYPQMQIEMVLNDRNLDLIDEGLDIAVRIGHLQDSSRVARRLGQVSRMTVASPDYLARCGEPRSPTQLAEHATIVGTQRPSLRAGKGIARLLSYQVADDLAAGTLVRLLADHEPLPMPVQLVAQQAQRMPLKVRAFWDYAFERLSALPQIQPDGRGK